MFKWIFLNVLQKHDQNNDLVSNSHWPAFSVQSHVKLINVSSFISVLVTIVCISRNVASSLVSDDVRVCRYVCVSSRTHTEMHDNERIRPRVRGGCTINRSCKAIKKKIMSLHKTSWRLCLAADRPEDYMCPSPPRPWWPPPRCIWGSSPETFSSSRLLRQAAFGFRLRSLTNKQIYRWSPAEPSEIYTMYKKTSIKGWKKKGRWEWKVGWELNRCGSKVGLHFLRYSPFHFISSFFWVYRQRERKARLVVT